MKRQLTASLVHVPRMISTRGMRGTWIYQEAWTCVRTSVKEPKAVQLLACAMGEPTTVLLICKADLHAADNELWAHTEEGEALAAHTLHQGNRGRGSYRVHVMHAHLQISAATVTGLPRMYVS